jgi:uncharacterized protein (UPF0179 family)
MKKESEACQSCPVKEVCDPNLTPERANGKRMVTTNPWNCRHLTCPAGVGIAKAEIRKLKANKIFFGHAHFSSKDKPSVRRVSIKTRIIESYQDGEWYSVGQSLDRTYIVGREHLPFKRIRNLSVLK